MVKQSLLFFIKIYQYFSPLTGKCCRFEPSCSSYAKEALSTTTLPKALRLILKRLKKCHPWGPYGFDPVPKHNP